MSTDAEQPTQRPTIKDAIEKHRAAYIEARFNEIAIPTLRANPTSQACQGSDITGAVYGSMLRFLQTEGLPPYYQVKAHIVLSAADEGNDEEENLHSQYTCLKHAQEALVVAKETYVHDPDDAGHLRYLEEMIQEEWRAYNVRKREYWSDSDDENDEID